MRETGENVIEAIEGIVIEVIEIEAIEVEVIAAIEGIEAIEAIAIVEIVAESVTIEEMRDEDEMTEMKATWWHSVFFQEGSNKKLLVTKGIATRSKDATSSSWHYY